MVRDRAGRTACHRLLERPQAPLCLGAQTAPSHPTSSRYRSNAESRIDLADAPLNAAIQRVSTLRPPKKRDNVTKPDSWGATLKKIEKEIANLDQWQNRGAIEYVDGPQRI